MKLPVSKLGRDLEGQLNACDVIVFDGECVLCSWFFRFVLRHDRDKRFCFAMAQAEIGQSLYGSLGMPLDDFQTNLVIRDGWIYTDLDAFAAAMSALGWPWKGLAVTRHLPGFIKRPVYRVIAANRYRVFGRYQMCIRPDAEVQERFLEDGII
ncbi:MAG: DCC1-like thiol-disulfide oxidoreductase family protein [Pseudomonadota bacterium]